jgi:hypothetical protein
VAVLCQHREAAEKADVEIDWDRQVWLESRLYFWYNWRGLWRGRLCALGGRGLGLHHSFCFFEVARQRVSARVVQMMMIFYCRELAISRGHTACS